MDSKQVNREIRRTIWPRLKAAGFGATTARTAWRHGKDKVDVVNFQSFNRYNADILGITTFSFAVNLGCFLRYVPPQRPLGKVRDGRPHPAAYECQFRGRLHGSVAQVEGGHAAIWHVDADGCNLASCLDDVAHRVGEALTWFARLDDRHEVLRILVEAPEVGSRLWGFGAEHSPARSYLTAYVAMALGEEPLATQAFEATVASGCYTHLFSSVEEARALARTTNAVAQEDTDEAG